MFDVINVSPFSSLKSEMTNAVCLACTDGTWIQLDFSPSGPLIVQLERRGDDSSAKHIETDADTFRTLFKPFFFQDAADSGMDEEIFSLVKLQFCYWSMYQIANRRYIAALKSAASEEA